MMKVYIENSDRLYNQMFANRGWELTDDPHNCDLFQFTGGADISPSLYKRGLHQTTFFDYGRDNRCTDLFNYAKSKNLPMAGICRGSQFLHAKAGGELVQDCDNHALWKGHQATLRDSGKSVLVSSTHHQMMYDNSVGEVLMAASLSTRKETTDDNGKNIQLEIGEDIEAMLYNKEDVGFNGLSFQPHPEYDGFEDCQDVYFEMIEKLLNL